MSSLEQSVKSQFEKVFSHIDWQLFKEMAEVSFSEAAFLKKSDFKRVPDELRLLVRNSRKRLLIGVGAELLLKAVYLKSGYCINKPRVHGSITFPFKPPGAGVSLDAAKTYMLAQLIDHLEKIVLFPKPLVVTEGLKIAKVFRNKEGHVVTSKHKFEADSFRSIEAALVAVYAEVFSERLAVRFSLEPREQAVWKKQRLI